MSFVGQELVTTLSTGQLGGRSDNRELAYRGEVLRSVLGGVFEAGADVSRISGACYGGPMGAAEFRAAWATHSAYVNFARTLTRGVSLESGVRLSDSTLVHHHALAP
jgi:hypothetical protein